MIPLMVFDSAITTFVDTLVIALIPAIPIAVGLLLTYLRTKQNEVIITSKPSTDHVQTLINQKVADVMAMNNTTEGKQ